MAGRLGFLFGVGAAMSAMIVLQLGASLSKPAMEAYGALEITWLRVTWAAVILVIFVRPRMFSYSQVQWRTALLLGAAISVTNLCYYQSLLYLPIGVATSIEFIGPLSVSAFYLVRSNPVRIIWPVLAGIGVLLLSTSPPSNGAYGLDWSETSMPGVAWALAAACGWGSYVVFLKKTGTAFSGLEGLSMSLVMAAVISAPFGLLGSGEGISVEAIRTAFGLAILVPLLPYIFEMFALRRMHARAFGVLMCVEPVISVVIGWIVLSEFLSVLQVSGVALVTIAIVRVTTLKSMAA